MQPTIEIIEDMQLGIDFHYPAVGADAKSTTGSLFPEQSKQAIDAADATFLVQPAATAQPLYSICAGVNRPLPTFVQANGCPVTPAQWPTQKILTL